MSAPLPPDDRPVARALGRAWAGAAALLVVLVFVVHRDPGAHDALFALVAAGALAATAVAWRRETIDPRAARGFTLAGFALALTAVTAAGDATGPYAFIQMWAVVQAFALLDPAPAARRLALAVAAYAVLLLALPAGAGVGAALVVVAAMVASGIVVAGLRSGAAAPERARAPSVTRTRDALTGLLDGSAFAREFAARIAEADGAGVELSLLAVDLDRFRAVNERFGYEAGDEVLVAVARALERCSRRTDIHGRTGGDAFAVLLTDTGRAGAEAAAARLRAQLAAVSQRFTVSVGIATYPEHGPGPGHLSEAAGRALRAAAAAGGDRAAVHPAPRPVAV